MTIESYEPGKVCTAFDITVRDSLQQTFLFHAANHTGYVAKQAHERKLHRYLERCEAQGYGFCPLVWETFGGATEEVHDTLKAWVRGIYERCGGTGGLPLSSLFELVVYRRISVHIQRHNAIMVSHRLPLPLALMENVQLQLPGAVLEVFFCSSCPWQLLGF
jgi:hypothetical protein